METQGPNNRRYPWSWTRVFAVIIGLLLAFLAVAFLLDWVKSIL